MTATEPRPATTTDGGIPVAATSTRCPSDPTAAVFQPGAETELVIRFSTVAGERGSPDTWRDPRGFSVKFYTSEGNFDLVGNNTPVFFIRDPMNSSTSSGPRSGARRTTCATTTCSGTSGRCPRSRRTRSPG